MNILFVLLNVIIILGEAEVAGGYSYTGERAIRTSVLNSFAYDRMARPNDSTTALVGLSILSLNTLDMEQQTFECTGFFTVLWHDERLQWRPSTYDDTEYIHALETEIWKPEIIITNAQEDVGLISDDHLIYRIKYTGEVEWEPLLSLTSDCLMDVTYFPFDNQSCTVELNSWGLPESELRLEPLWTSVQMTSFREGGSWKIEGTYVERGAVTGDVHNQSVTFSQLVFRFDVRRKPGNYIFNTIVPMVVSSFLMTFTNVIPTKSGERLVSGFLVLVINTLLLTIFMQQIPDIAITTSVLGQYLISSFCFDCLRMVVSIFVVKLYHRPTHLRVNIVIRFFIHILRWFVLARGPYRPPEPVVEEDTVSVYSIPTDYLRKVERTARRNNAVHPIADEDGFTEHVKVRDDQLPPLDPGFDLHMWKGKKSKVETDEGTDYKVLDNNEKKTNTQSPKMTWHYVAFVLDRLIFVAFLSVKIAFNIKIIGRLFENSR
ncbi:acetylcholine receptor subunit alpha-like isoform X2 [Mya arenaria]|uniref:acetylcholine receptor subunit alpha-like isoform X2 n=1 Tax=Mya arenaria TaxID=6604 RepID=UPI0022E100A9|nr:acetylcholine receptor subunit alpha-like isoform X2 [Mya arenaria]